MTELEKTLLDELRLAADTFEQTELTMISLGRDLVARAMRIAKDHVLDTIRKAESGS